MTRYIDMLTEDNASIQITMTNEQYLKQCDVIADGALDDAARSLWEIVKTEVCKHLDKVCDLSNIDGEYARREQRAKVNNMRKRLDAYNMAFCVLGCKLEVEDMWSPSDHYPDRLIGKVVLAREGHSLGCIALW